MLELVVDESCVAGFSCGSCINILDVLDCCIAFLAAAAEDLDCFSLELLDDELEDELDICELITGHDTEP